MRNTSLSDKFKIVQAVVPTAGGTGALSATEVDGTGFGRVMFIFSMGAAGTGATLTPKIQSATATGGSFADVTSAAFTQITAAAGASKQYVIDMPVNSARPFMNVVGTIGTQTLANGCVAILYRPITYPVPTTYATQVIKV